MFRNILVAVDGSRHAERALTEAIELATAANGRLTLITAIPRPPSWASTPATAAVCEPLAAELEREARQILSDAVERVPEDVPVTTILTPKPIRRALLAQIKAGNHDLVVMGSRGRGALTASLLGSVSHFVLNHSPIPVLVIHTEEDQGSAEARAPVLQRQLRPHLELAVPFAPPAPRE
jgi:nucleotide-binding universal stress UspA family protein